MQSLLLLSSIGQRKPVGVKWGEGEIWQDLFCCQLCSKTRPCCKLSDSLRRAHVDLLMTNILYFDPGAMMIFRFSIWSELIDGSWFVGEDLLTPRWQPNSSLVLLPQILTEKFMMMNSSPVLPSQRCCLQNYNQTWSLGGSPRPNFYLTSGWVSKRMMHVSYIYNVALSNNRPTKELADSLPGNSFYFPNLGLPKHKT